MRKQAYIRKHAPFFYEHASQSYFPDRETLEQGRQRGAEELAAAEHKAIQRGAAYRWSVDPDIDSSDFSEDKPVWKLWQCAMFDREGKCIASLHGIDFGRDEGPQCDPYSRIVQAELADEANERF